VEYALLIALVGSVMCLGVGATVKQLFGGSVQCFISQFHSGGTATGCGAGTTSDGGDTGGDPPSGGGEASPSPSPTPTPTESVTPAPPPTASP
jgi:hypothetical protein